MTDPSRLKVTSDNNLSKALIDSARADHSMPGAHERALRALGIGAAISAATASAASATGLSSKGAGLLVLKWIGVGAFVGAVTLTSINYLASSTGKASPPLVPAPTSQPVQATRMNAARAVEHGAASAQPILPVAVPVVQPNSARVRSIDAVSAGFATVNPSSAAPTAVQLAALQEIRAALAAGTPERALGLLDSFDRRFRGSALTEEAAVLRVEALVDSGNSEASARGRAFLEQYPRSAYAQHVRSKLHLR
jgi:hypothetical protein